MLMDLSIFIFLIQERRAELLRVIWKDVTNIFHHTEHQTGFPVVDYNTPPCPLISLEGCYENAWGAAMCCHNPLDSLNLPVVSRDWCTGLDVGH